jgi:uncharacterized membrane protein
VLDSAHAIRAVQPTQALALTQAVRQQAQAAHNTEWQLRSRMQEALIFRIMGVADSADAILEWVGEHPQLDAYPDVKAQRLFLQGYGYVNSADPAQAIPHLNAAILIAEQLGDSLLVAKCSGTLYHVYENFGQFKMASRSNLRAMGAYRSLNDSLGIGRCYTDRADIRLCPDTTLALAYLDTALAIFRAIGYRTGEAIVLHNKAHYSGSQLEPAEKQALVRAALALNLEIGNSQYIAINLNSISQSLFRQRKYLAALDTAQLAYHYALEDPEVSVLEAVMHHLARCLHKTGNSTRAYEVLDSIHQLYITAFNVEKFTELGRLQQQYAFESQQQIAAREAEREAQALQETQNFQFLLIFGIVGVAFIGLLLTGRLKVSQRVAGVLTLFVVLLLFEALLVFLDPLMDAYTGGLPLPKLGANLLLAIGFTFGHEWVNRRLGKNNPTSKPC